MDFHHLLISSLRPLPLGPAGGSRGTENPENLCPLRNEKFKASLEDSGELFSRVLDEFYGNSNIPSTYLIAGRIFQRSFLSIRQQKKSSVRGVPPHSVDKLHAVNAVSHQRALAVPTEGIHGNNQGRCERTITVL